MMFIPLDVAPTPLIIAIGLVPILIAAALIALIAWAVVRTVRKKRARREGQNVGACGDADKKPPADNNH